MSLSELVAILCGTTQFKKKEMILDHMQNQLIQDLLARDCETFKPLHDFHNAVKAERELDQERSERCILPLIELFKEIRKESCLNNVENLKNLDVTSYKKKILFFERQLSQQEQSLSISLKKLLAEFDELEDVVSELRRNMEPVDCPIVVKPFTVSSIPISAAFKYPEVEQFQNFLQDWGGHTGGWTVEDHNIFLKLRARHNPNSVAYYLRQEMPDISSEEVAKHESWYQQYCKLKAAQQKAITDWRESQNVSKKTDGYLAVVEPPACNDSARKRDPAVKEKIQSWKTSKQAEMETEKQRNLLLEEKRKSEEETRALKQMELREKVKLYKAKKFEEAHAAAVAEQDRAVREAHKAAEIANSMIRQYREEDSKWLERKKMQRLQLILEERQRLDREKALAATVSKDITVTRDPHRILQPTKVWEKRLKNSESDEEPEKSGVVDVDQIKHLGTPEWRLGL